MSQVTCPKMPIDSFQTLTSPPNGPGPPPLILGAFGFIIIVIGGIIWNVFCVMVVAKRMLPNCWFERAIAEMGQSMGVTATGLLLLRAVDPDGRTEATSAFGYKQLLHEPFMGGGLWTASAVVLVATHGALPIFLISVSAIIIWLIVWKLIIRPTFPTPQIPMTQ